MVARKPIDMTGQVHNRLTVISFSHHKNVAYWKCKCSCGVEKVVSRPNLLTGNTKSCGCYGKENIRNHGHTIARHSHTQNVALGLGTSKTYNSWIAMRQRCYNKNNIGYSYYGGKGVIICDRWDVFENFLEDMGERPDGKTLDRYPNPFGNYEPGNCRWATLKEQQNNRRDNWQKQSPITD